MEKNTILAVVLSTLVLIISYSVMGALNTSKQAEQQASPPQTEQVQPAVTETTPPAVQEPPSAEQTGVSVVSPVADTSPQLQEAEAPDAGPQVMEYVEIENEYLKAVFSSAGGNMVSLKLKLHYDNNDNIEMIFAGNSEPKAFSIAFGGLDAQPVTSLFYVNRISDYSVEFYRDFILPRQSQYDMERSFRLVKRYDFKPNEYMFELTITLDGGYTVPSFNFFGNAYTLSFGPQIGPKFEKMDRYNDYRNSQIFLNGKLKNAKYNEQIDSRPAWAAISGKYFSFIAIPYLTQYSLVFSQPNVQGIPVSNTLNIVRPAVNASRVSDTYRFYLGPKSQDALAVYDNGKNEFGLKDARLVDAASSRGILSPLEKILKWFLVLFHKIIPNYGIAIFLLTLLIKLLFFPLTKKGSEAMVRMQALTPKIKEIQDKYKNNPQKLQAEMGAFYKANNYNPLSGCLPMLLQLPIFIAMYNLFNNHFDLRGASFIPGWIPDLSVPEYIVSFPDGVRLPILGWTALRLLPFIYVASQLIYSKVTQMPGQQQNAQMKMMMYVMPIVFFFVLYNVPSGLLIYWIFSNLLTMVQQIIINKYVMAKKAQEEALLQEREKNKKPVIAPPKKKKK
jgi:YidC/Oxa1 family membrane protein insertase